MSADLPVLAVLGVSVAVGRITERVREQRQRTRSKPAIEWAFTADPRAPVFFRVIRARSEVTGLVAAQPEGVCWSHDGVQHGPIRVGYRSVVLGDQLLARDEVLESYARPPYLEVLTTRGVASVEVGEPSAVQWWVEQLKPLPEAGSVEDVPAGLDALRRGA